MLSACVWVLAVSVMVEGSSCVAHRQAPKALQKPLDALQKPPGAPLELPGAPLEPPGAPQKPLGAPLEPPDAQEPPTAPRCDHSRCRYLGQDRFAYYMYEVEGNNITISYELPNYYVIYCNGAGVLGSPAMPRLEPAGHVRLVRLLQCPLPRGSLGDALARLNVQLRARDAPGKPATLWFTDLPPSPSLAAAHFVGLECLPILTILNLNTATDSERGFLAPLRNLRELRIMKLKMSDSELDEPPPSLSVLSLEFTGTKRLPEAMVRSTELRQLIVQEDIPFDAGSVPPGLTKLRAVSPGTTLRLDAAPALEILDLFHWVEPLPPPVTRCAALRRVHLSAPAMRTLPDKWLAECSQLEVLAISDARNLVTLPPTLVTPQGPLRDFSMTQGVLETLPEGLVDNLLQLTTLQFDENRLRTLPRNLLNELRYGISSLSLSSNDLDGGVFEVLGQLKAPPPKEWQSSLGVRRIFIDLSQNPRIGDVCDADGYSPIRHKSDMQTLLLEGTGVSRICRDWREAMPELSLLDLRNTNISELSYEDLQFTRTVQSQVLLRGAPVAAVRVTREDYNKAARAQPSFTTMDIDSELQCDCRMYWARRVLDHPLAQHTVPGIRELRCVGGGLLRDVPPEDMTCAAPDECAADNLPAGCACAARPDVDPAHERWLVRVRCDNSSLGFVQRRIHPFYPVHRSKNEGVYLKQTVNSLK